MKNFSKRAKFITLLTKFKVLIFAIVLLYALPGPAISKIDVRDSIVKIYCVQNRPDYENPWNMSGPEMSGGSGCVIDGKRILTNAHVVSDNTFILHNDLE